MTPTVIDSPAQPRPMSEQTDMQVLGRFSIWHDSQAFAEIFRRYAGFVFSTALRVVGDADRAQDVSQETFFRLMQRPHEINQSVGAWLHRTATHLAVDSLRSESARRRREINYDTTRDREASSWSELSPAVDQAISELPDELRVLMVQHYLLGRSQADLAAEASQSPATICRRIQQGLNQLRQRLRLKGIHAMPVALAGLLCHTASRQAPAALMCELGKMAMYAGATSAAAKGASAAGKTLANSGRIANSLLVFKMFLLLLAFTGAIFFARLAANRWFASPAPAMQHDDNQPVLHKNIVGRTA